MDGQIGELIELEDCIIYSDETGFYQYVDGAWYEIYNGDFYLIEIH